MLVNSKTANLNEAMMRLASQYSKKRNMSMLHLKYWLGTRINNTLGAHSAAELNRALEQRDMLNEFSSRVGHPVWMVRSAMVMAHDLTPAKFEVLFSNNITSFSTVLRMFSPSIPATWRRKIRDVIAGLFVPCYTTYRRTMNDVLALAVKAGDMTAAEVSMVMGASGNTMAGTVSKSTRSKLHQIAYNSNTGTTDLVGELVMAWEPMLDRFSTMSKTERHKLLKRVMNSTATK